MRRIIQASSNEGDLVLDFFGGSGSTGAACLEYNRNFILIDNNPQSIQIMHKRFASQKIEWIGCEGLTDT